LGVKKTGTVASLGAFSIRLGQKLATDDDGFCSQFGRVTCSPQCPLKPNREFGGVPSELNPPPCCPKPPGGIPWLVKMVHGRLCGGRLPDHGETIPGMPGSPAPRRTEKHPTTLATGFCGCNVASALAATASALKQSSLLPPLSSRKRDRDNPVLSGIARRFLARVPERRTARRVRNWFYRRREFSWADGCLNPNTEANRKLTTATSGGGFYS